MTVTAILRHTQQELEQLLNRQVVVTYTTDVWLSPDSIMKVCADYFGVTVEDMKSSKRKGMLPSARQCYSYICYRKLGNKLRYVAHALNRHYANIIQGANKVDDLLSVNDGRITEAITSIERKLFFNDAH